MDKKILTLAVFCLAFVSMAASAGAFKAAECKDDIDIDGDTDDDGWDDAKDGSFGNVTYYACYDATNLYFRIDIKDTTSTGDDLVQLWIDTEGNGGDEIEDDDFGFEVNRGDDDPVEYKGTDDVDSKDWQAAVDDGASKWVAEYGIKLSKLGISPGEKTNMKFAIYVDDEATVSDAGPGSADEDEPNTWTTLGPSEGTWGKAAAAVLSNGAVAPLDGITAGEPGRYAFSVTYRQDDGIAPTQIRVFINNQGYGMSKDIQNCNAASGCKYSYGKSLAEGSYAFYFQAAYTGGGVRFPESQNLEITVAKRNLKPSVRITAPADGSIASGQITISGTASDPDGNADLTAVDVRIDSGPWTQISGAASWTYAYNTANIADGVHTVYARARDAKSAESDLDDITITVKNKPEVTAETDTDSDGMPDLWELAYGLDPEDPRDASRDPDGDGLTNLEEYAAGKNPKKAELAEPVDTGNTTPKQTAITDNTVMMALVALLVLAVILIAYFAGKSSGRGGEYTPRRERLAQTGQLPPLRPMSENPKPPEADKWLME